MARKCDSVDCELNLRDSSFSLINPVAIDSGVCSGVVRVLDLDEGQRVRTVTLQIELQNGDTCCIRAEDIEISLSSAQPNDWRRFLASHFEQLIDIVASIVLFQEDEEDLLLVGQSAPGSVWVLYLEQVLNGNWHGQLVERRRPEQIDITYSLTSTGQQREYADQLFKQFTSWLPENSLLVRNRPRLQPKPFTAKVHPSELWFLRFPLSLFCHLQYGAFAAFEGVEWIVTEKTFVRYRDEGKRIRQELSDVQKLLGNSVVVVNTYREHESNKLCREGTELIIKILSLLKEVQVGPIEVSLRWYLNPSIDEVEHLLLDPETAYFFADFEASSGQWEPGEGEHLSWYDHKPIHPAKIFPAPVCRRFPSEDLNCSLSHIRLMRVFHCNSIFNPYAASADSREPADRHSIVRRLLERGAQRVEGGMTEESYLDFLCSLLNLFCRGQLFFILQWKCMERGVDFRQIIGSANGFLNVCHWDPIPEL